MMEVRKNDSCAEVELHPEQIRAGCFEVWWFGPDSPSARRQPEKVMFSRDLNHVVDDRETTIADA